MIQSLQASPTAHFVLLKVRLVYDCPFHLDSIYYLSALRL